MTQNEIKVSDSDIIKTYETDLSLHEAAAELNMTTVTLWRKAKRIGLKWSDKKIRKGTSGKKLILSEILEGKYPHYQTFKLKNRLIKEKIKENKCEICGISEWMEKPLMIHLDHIDGNGHNHILTNLRMLCPNCHSQTDTWCGKIIK